LGRFNNLPRPLGPLFSTEDSFRYFFPLSDNRIYERFNSSWRTYCSIPRPGRNLAQQFTLTEAPLLLLNDLGRASVTQVTANRIAMCSYCTETFDPPICLSMSKFGSWLSLETAWILDGLILPLAAGLHIANSIWSGKCIGVSDGSFMRSSLTGSAAMTLQGPTSKLAILCSCVCPGFPEDQSAYRSELIGIYQMVLTVYFLCQSFDIPEGLAVLACDGLAAISCFSSCDTPTPCTSKHFDIISATRRLMRDCPIQWNTRHILGHQLDRQSKSTGSTDVWTPSKLFGQLDRWGSLNDDTGTLEAKA
jgi:hypothetical protein